MVGVGESGFEVRGLAVERRGQKTTSEDYVEEPHTH